MSTDLGMVMLDIVCTFWESAMFVYLVHAFKKRKLPLKVDIAMMCIFVASAEIATFAGSNVLLKMMLLMLCCSVSGIFIYRNEILPLEMLLAFNAFAFVQTGVEVCISTFYELMKAEFRYEGLGFIFHQWQWYIISHLLTSIMILLIRIFLLRLQKDITVREKVVLTLMFYGLMVLLIGMPANPTGNTFLYKIGMVAGIMILAIVVLLLILYFNESIATRLKQQREEHQLQELQMQYQYYNERLEEEQRVRQVYHDMKNHLLILQSQLSRLSGTQTYEKERKETEKMIVSLQNQISDYESYYETGNAFLDVILRDKMKKACERQIDFHVEIDFSEGDFIDGLDISTIFGNALDNAIEACGKLAEDERFITVKVGIKNQFLLIQIDNSAGENNETGHTAKEDGFLHGFGKKNIRQAVEKYHGHCKWSFEQGVYSLSVLIPLSQ